MQMVKESAHRILFLLIRIENLRAKSILNNSIAIPFMLVIISLFHLPLRSEPHFSLIVVTCSKNMFEIIDNTKSYVCYVCPLDAYLDDKVVSD